MENFRDRSIIDEWGRCKVRKDDIVDISEYLLDEIALNNQSITAVRVTDINVTYNRKIGEIIGRSKCIRYLMLDVFPHQIMSQEKIQSIFGSLACNQSIEAICIDVSFVNGNNYDEEISQFTKQIFEALRPMFQDNLNLQYFQLQSDGMVSDEDLSNCARDIIVSSPSIKSVSLKLNMDWKELLTFIIAKRQIQHLCLSCCIYRDCKFSAGACDNIKRLLSDELHMLESFRIKMIRNWGSASRIESWDDVAFGLFSNQSPKCVDLHLQIVDMRQFLRRLKDHSGVNSIQTLKLHCNEPMRFPPLHKVGNKLPNITNLTLTNFLIGTHRREIDYTDQPPFASSLRELSISCCLGSDLSELSSYLLGVRTLTSLELSHTSKSLLLPHDTVTSSAPWNAFFNSVTYAKYLVSIKMGQVMTGNVMMQLFSNWISSTQSLKTLEVCGSRYVTSVGWQSFALALESLDELEDIQVDCRAFGQTIQEEEDHDVDAYLGVLTAKTTLKSVTLTLTALHQFQEIARALQSPDCSMLELNIHCIHGHTVNCNEARRIIFNSLSTNTSLRSLRLPTFGWNTSDWYSILDLLWDTSSIEATVQSNHTLESLFVGDGRLTSVPFVGIDDLELSTDMFDILYMNKDANKHAVIRQKVLRTNGIDEFHFVPTSLPIVFSWLGGVDVNLRFGLSQMFRILRVAPNMIRNKADAASGVKRKCSS